jgi:mannitol/fructose-specific phosphotransferase system IIA component (Ntr-type)
MTLAQFTEPKLLSPRLLSQHRDGAIVELSQCQENAGRIENAMTFAQAVWEHESLASAVFDGVAFPLARGQVVKELSFVVGLSPQGIRWGAGQVPAVHTVVLFAVPLAEGETHLSLVLTFSNFLNDKTALAALQQCARPEEMLEVLSQVMVVRRGVQAPRGGPLAEY